MKSVMLCQHEPPDVGQAAQLPVGMGTEITAKRHGL